MFLHYVFVCWISTCLSFYCHFVSFLLSVLCMCALGAALALWPSLYLSVHIVKLFMLVYLSRAVYEFIQFVICLLSVSFWHLLPETVFYWYWVTLPFLFVPVTVHLGFATLICNCGPCGLLIHALLQVHVSIVPCPLVGRREIFFWASISSFILGCLFRNAL